MYQRRAYSTLALPGKSTRAMELPKPSSAKELLSSSVLRQIGCPMRAQSEPPCTDLSTMLNNSKHSEKPCLLFRSSNILCQQQSRVNKDSGNDNDGNPSRQNNNRNTRGSTSDKFYICLPYSLYDHGTPLPSCV